MAATRNKHWQPEKLEDICAQITDGKHGDCQDETDSGYYFLSCKDVANGRLNYEGARQITEVDFHDTHRRTKFAPSDVLITNSGTIGRMAIATDNELTRRTTFQKSVAILKPITSRVEPTFLYYALQSEVRRLIEFAGGTAQKNLLLRDLRAFEVNLPALPIQRRIAGILSAYDELIENSQRRIKILEAMARALYCEWFVHFRFPGHESVPRIPSPLGDIPQGWEVKPVREVAGLVSRGPSLTYVDSGGVQVINQRCVRNEEIEMQAVQYAAPLSEKKSHLYLQPRDVLINSMGVGTLGRVSRNLSIDEPTIIHNCITVVRGRAGEPTTAFLYYRLSDCQDHFESVGVGATGQTSLRIETIEDVQVALPPVGLLTAFESSALPMWTQVGVLKRQIERLRHTRDLLLPRLLSGQIDVEAIAS